jgi:hypothetical protein
LDTKRRKKALAKYLNKTELGLHSQKPGDRVFWFAPNVDGANLDYLLEPFGKLLQRFIGI